MKDKKLIIVESPSKAKTISGYVPYDVIASYGHIRQLVPSSGSVIIEKDTIKFVWETNDEKWKKIEQKIKYGKYDEVILASDMDREGEAIAFHLKHLIEKVKDTKITRITFFEITKDSITDSLQNRKKINDSLVNSYFARVALDYLMGYGISPLIWKRFGRNQSAGRVQSCILKVIALRQKEINFFQKEVSFYVEANFQLNDQSISGELVKIDSKPIGKVKDKAFFDNIKLDGVYTVNKTTEKKVKIPTIEPFITSSLQQEASTKLNMKIERIMRIAQKLYEGVLIHGQQKALITYMRTDSINISEGALKKIRAFIKEEFPQLLSKEEKKYSGKKIKNAQEAHECIRPTDIEIKPDSIQQFLEKEEWQLYNLIWQRTMQSQMEDGLRRQVSLEWEKDGMHFQSGFSAVIKPGFLDFYGTYEKDKHIPEIKKGTSITFINSQVKERATHQPSRYTESSIVKEMEQLGIGRPSTYASIIETVLKREYAILNKKHFDITTKGEVVYYFLENFFSRYLDLKFTAEMEDKLDEISKGKMNFESAVIEFANYLNENINGVNSMNNIEILQTINNTYWDFHPQVFCSCGGKTILKTKFSTYLQCESCANIIKINETVESIGEYEIIHRNSQMVIKMSDKSVYLPEKFKEELNEENVKLIVSLPFQVIIQDTPVIVAMSKFGFYAKYSGQYCSINWKDLVSNAWKEKVTRLIQK